MVSIDFILFAYREPTKTKNKNKSLSRKIFSKNPLLIFSLINYLMAHIYKNTVLVQILMVFQEDTGYDTVSSNSLKNTQALGFSLSNSALVHK